MATKYATVADPETTAKAYGRDRPCSPKSGRNVARAIRGMPLERAKAYLQDVVAMKTAVPFPVRNLKLAHRRGKGFGPGRYPVKTAKEFLDILESAEANAEYKGLDVDILRITHASAYQGTVQKAFTPRAQGRATPSYDRLCNIELVLTEVEPEED